MSVGEMKENQTVVTIASNVTGRRSICHLLVGTLPLLALLAFFVRISLFEYKVTNGRRIRSKVAMCLMMRDEDDVVELITYHYRMGIGKFYVYGIRCLAMLHLSR